MKKFMEGMRLLFMLSVSPLAFVLDWSGAALGLLVRAFKEGYERGRK